MRVLWKQGGDGKKGAKRGATRGDNKGPAREMETGQLCGEFEQLKGILTKILLVHHFAGWLIGSD